MLYTKETAIKFFKEPDLQKLENLANEEIEKMQKENFRMITTASMFSKIENDYHLMLAFGKTISKKEN